MGKIAFVFPGQGAQYPGMGMEFNTNIYGGEKVFDAAEKVKPGIKELCFNGSKEDLAITSNTQPCMFTVEMAAAQALANKGIKADVTAGFSLGELAALTYSGVFSLETGLELVCRRGELMRQAAESKNTGMAAVLKLSNEEVEKICEGFDEVYPVNYNCTGQVSVAGVAENMKDLIAKVKEAGGKAIPLKVSGGFHSPFMDDAAASFGEILENVEFNSPEIPVYSNYSGKLYGEDFKNILRNQINNPVRWNDIIENMIADGVDVFIEVGPGNTLSSMIKRINSEVFTANVENAETLADTAEKLNAMGII